MAAKNYIFQKQNRAKKRKLVLYKQFYLESSLSNQLCCFSLVLFFDLKFWLLVTTDLNGIGRSACDDTAEMRF